jgi:16S rRNA (guanine527-N7)-methyltransferase
MFHVKHEAWALQADRLGVALGSDQLERLAAYEGLLSRIAVPRGMIAPSDEDRLWERHLLDGLRAVSEIPAGASVADIGSGAGIPGIPLAIALPASQFSLIEHRRARVAFLEAVVDDLRLSNVAVLPARVEDLGGRFQVCVARAFSSAPASWKATERLLAPGGILVYWGGESFDPAVLAEEGVPWRLSTHSDLARTGPLVIMGPQ